MTTTKLDYAESFDEPACRAALSAVMEALGCSLADCQSHKGGEPQRTYRQIARMVAVERGFDAGVVADICGCSQSAVRSGQQGIERRLERERRLAGNGAAEHPLLPVVAKARAAVANSKCTTS